VQAAPAAAFFRLLASLIPNQDPSFWLSSLSELSTTEPPEPPSGLPRDLFCSFVNALGQILPRLPESDGSALLGQLFAFLSSSDFAEPFRDCGLDAIAWQSFLRGIDPAICLSFLADVGLSREIDCDPLFSLLPTTATATATTAGAGAGAGAEAKVAMAVLLRNLEVAVDPVACFSAVSNRIPVTLDLFDGCCRFALCALRRSLPAFLLLSSPLFAQLRDLIFLVCLDSLVLFLRVIACATDASPDFLDDFDGAFLFQVFHLHFSDPRIPLLVLPLINRHLVKVLNCEFITCDFISALLYVCDDGHFRARARALVVLDRVMESTPAFLSVIIAECNPASLVAFLSSGERGPVLATLRFVDRVLHAILTGSASPSVIPAWLDSGILACLSELTEFSPSVERILVMFDRLANLVL
jgi:hypothetical protein